MKEKINALHADLRATYPYVSVSREVVELFIRTYNSYNVHLLYDYILSQDLADAIEE